MTTTRVVAICGGGGKTTIANTYPALFIDIDTLVWSDRTYHEAITAAVDRNDQPAFGRIYRQCLVEKAEQLRESCGGGESSGGGKVVLVHHPCNAEWLGATLLGTMRPIQTRHARNIADRSGPQMVTAIESWKSLDDVPGLWEYSTHEELERRLLSLVDHTSCCAGEGDTERML